MWRCSPAALRSLAIGNGEKTEGGPQTITLAAPKGAAATGFAPTTLSLEADKPTVLEFDNQDPGVQHNVVIFGEDPAKNPKAAAIFTGALTTGPEKATYKVPTLSAGTYYFHCEVHPTTMFGTIAVGGGGGAGGGGLTGTAKSLAFSTKEIDLPAGQAVTLTFDNQDPGIPHNIAIYTDASKAKNLFRGAEFPGVASQPYDIPALDPDVRLPVRRAQHDERNGGGRRSGGRPARAHRPRAEPTSHPC